MKYINKKHNILNMKFLLISGLIAITAMTSKLKACSKPNDDSLTQNSSVTFKLYPTQNMYNFIKLDTRNGKMWQVQFDISGNNRIVVDLNTVSLSESENEVNKFALYPTKNMYTFILLDQQNGRTWQVQWSTEKSERGIIPIE